jgi:hypothetical protein
VAHQIGFVEEARRRSVAVAILFTVTPDDSDASAQRNVRTRAASRQVSAGQWKFGDGASTRTGAWSTQVNRNAAFLIRRFEYGNAVGIPLNAHIELQRWLRRIYLEFRELDLRILPADLQARFFRRTSRARANRVGGTPCGLHFLRSSSASRSVSLWGRWLWSLTSKMFSPDGAGQEQILAAEGPHIILRS